MPTKFVFTSATPTTVTGPATLISSDGLSATATVGTVTAAVPQPLRVWFFGTSLTANGNQPAGTRVRDSVPTRVGARLAQHVGGPVEVSNKGIGGRMFVWEQPGATIAPIAATLVAEIDAAADSAKPHAVYSEGGINDLTHVTKESIYQAHLTLAAAVKARGINYVPVTIAPVGPALGAAVNADRLWINNALRTAPPGTFSGLLDAEVLASGTDLAAAFDIGDGLHWNPYGNLRVADAAPLAALAPAAT